MDLKKLMTQSFLTRTISGIVLVVLLIRKLVKKARHRTA